MTQLEVGNGRQSYEQYKTHFSLWAAHKSPLIMGHSLALMSNETKEILMNKEIIAINQDELGTSVRLVEQGFKYSLWVGDLMNGDKVVLVFNPCFATSTSRLQIPIESLGYSLDTKLCTRDLWLHKSAGCFKEK